MVDRSKHPRSSDSSDLRVRPGDIEAMRLALEEAAAAGAAGDVPVGAVMIDAAGGVLAAAGNRREQDCDPTAHAEILAIKAAAVRLGDWRLTGCTLVVTLEPCSMCAGALVLGRIARLVIGADDPKAGAVGSVWDLVRDPRQNHRIEVITGVAATESGQLLQRFFASRR